MIHLFEKAFVNILGFFNLQLNFSVIFIIFLFKVSIAI